MKKLLSALMMSFAVSAFALDNLDQWASKVWSQPLPVEKDSVFVFLTQEGPGKFKKAATKTTTKVKPDGSYVQDYSGPDETSHSEMLKNGTLLVMTSDSTEDKKIYNVKVSPDRKQAWFRTEEKGKAATVKTLALKANNIIMSAEYVSLIRQLWQNGVRGGFAFKGLPPDGSMEIDMETRLIETSVPWKVNDKFDFPADFKVAFPDSQKYLVADFYLGGLFSLMYSFHNYWVFKITPSGLEYVGSFGGDPQKATFSYRTE